MLVSISTDEINVSYYGKLRRRREFLKSIQLSQTEEVFWEVWFNKCARANSLLPFLNNRKSNSHVWLFTIETNLWVRVGLTVISNDLSGREYPFVIYSQVDKCSDSQQSNMISSKKELRQMLVSFIHNFDAFKQLIAIGEPAVDLISRLSILTTDTQTTYELKELFTNIIEHVRWTAQPTSDLDMVSYWTNLQTGISIKHNGALTCTLFNKIYG